MGAVLSPSDLRTFSGNVQVGGRVVAAVTEWECILGDALGQVKVTLKDPQQLRPGELVAVQGCCQGGEIAHGTVLSRFRAPETTGETEFARLSWQGVGARLEARAKAMSTVRAYFARERFIEVDTPIRVSSPQLDAGVDALPAGGGWLVASPEYHMKRLLAGGLPRLYELVHCSRREELGPWHEPEFMMLEWYRSFARLDEILGDTEELVCEIVRQLGGTCRVRAPGSGLEVEVSQPFEQRGVADAFLEFAGIRDVVDLAQSDEDRYFRLLVSQVEPALARLSKPVFLRDYPISQAALARPKRESPEYAERFELYLGGIELCNGYEELTDPGENARRLRCESERRCAAGQLAPVDERFLSALREGLPPAAGNALGLDRLIALALGASGIAAVQAFPSSQL